MKKNSCKRITLNGVKTRTTRYRGRDGKERAVLYWDDYEYLLKRIERRNKAKKL